VFLIYFDVPPVGQTVFFFFDFQTPGYSLDKFNCFFARQGWLGFTVHTPLQGFNELAVISQYPFVLASRTPPPPFPFGPSPRLLVPPFFKVSAVPPF